MKPFVFLCLFASIALTYAKDLANIDEEPSNSTCACNAIEIEELKAAVSTLKDLFCGVGIKDGRIPDSAMTASSYHTSLVTAAKARLDAQTFWHPNYPPSVFRGEWLQVDMGTPTRIVGVVTQGRTTPSIPQWIITYNILYGNSTNYLQTIQNQPDTDLVFQGNVDQNSHKVNRFPQPITARYFRIVALTYYYAPCLRIEYLVC